MSIEAIEYGVQAEDRVTRWFRIRCDDSPSGFIEISKTPPTGANAMTVTIKPLHGEPFTVNADVLRSAVKLALHAPRKSFEEAYRDEHWRRKQVKRLKAGDRVEIADRGRCDYPRLARVENVDDYYVHVEIEQHPEEAAEGVPTQRRKFPKFEVLRVLEEAENAA